MKKDVSFHAGEPPSFMMTVLFCCVIVHENSLCNVFKLFRHLFLFLILILHNYEKKKNRNDGCVVLRFNGMQ